VSRPKYMDPNLAVRSVGWDQLIQRAIQRAEQLKDPRLGMLRQGARQGRAQQTLKRLGIIGEVDLAREFPP
jgi:hypothetical protein